MAQPGGFWILFDTKKYQGEFPIEDIKPSANSNIVVAKKHKKKTGHPEIVTRNCKSLIVNDRKCISKKVRKSGEVVKSKSSESFRNCFDYVARGICSVKVDHRDEFRNLFDHPTTGYHTIAKENVDTD